ncbi:MAG: metallophosphoesterase [Terracidiphilus sp.]
MTRITVRREPSELWYFVRLNPAVILQVYAGCMFRPGFPCLIFAAIAFTAIALTPAVCPAQAVTAPLWTFAVSGDSRNCGDFVMPAIAAKVKAENDAFYWHLGDFRWMSQPDQDLLAMEPAGTELSKESYQSIAWDDFLAHQMTSFGSMPVFLGRGNHEDVPPMTREGYVTKFSSFLDRPEIAAQRISDGAAGAPIGPWYHWTQGWVDFITLDNSSHDEFSDAQLKWLRAVLDHDLAPNSGVRAIVAGMHEALPHSTGSEHAMDDWDLGDRTGELVYNWFYGAQAAGKHVYLIASHSHYYSPNVYNTPYWKQYSKTVLPGLIVGTAGAHRYQLPKTADKAAKTHIYGYVQGAVEADGTIDFTLHELSEDDLIQSRWPNAPLDAIHECYIHNADE